MSHYLLPSVISLPSGLTSSLLHTFFCSTSSRPFFYLAERVNLPAIVSYDGYITSHQKHNVEVFADSSDVRNYIGPKQFDQNKYLNDLDHPITVGAHQTTDFINNRYQMQAALNDALEIYEEEAKAYEEMTGRNYAPVEGIVTGRKHIIGRFGEI